MTPEQVIGPIFLFFLMLVVGLELTVADFRRVIATPGAVVGGTLAQILLLPLMTWLLVAALEVPPVFGAGAVLVATAPGAGISNIMTALAGANTALSVTLTGFASALAVVTLPLLSAAAMSLFLTDAIEVEVPVFTLVAQLMVSLLLPITLGMMIRARRPDLAIRYGAVLQRSALVVLIVIVSAAVYFDDGERPVVEDAGIGLLAAAAWTLLAMAIGYGVAAALRLPSADRFTFLIEFSARNIAVAGIVALSGLGRLDLTFFSGLYMAVGYPMVGIAVFLRRRYVSGVASDAP